MAASFAILASTYVTTPNPISRAQLTTNQKNPRFECYCPYCQLAPALSSHLSPRPASPPAYTTIPSPYLPAPAPSSSASLPPPYSPTSEKPRQDTIHYLHSSDTIPSLSLRYTTPAHILRAHNNLAIDSLLLAREFIVIPVSHYPSGISASPHPLESEEEQRRRSQIRRFMTRTKCVEWHVAAVLLEEDGWDVDGAVARWMEGEEWVKRQDERRMAKKSKGTWYLFGGGR